MSILIDQNATFIIEGMTAPPRGFAASDGGHSEPVYIDV